MSIFWQLTVKPAQVGCYLNYYRLLQTSTGIS